MNYITFARKLLTVETQGDSKKAAEETGYKCRRSQNNVGLQRGKDNRSGGSIVYKGSANS